jgi:hypothetical protein
MPVNPDTGEVTESPRTLPAAVAAAIVAVKKQVKQLGHDDKNDHGRYNFVSVDKFYATIGKLMADAGLALLIDETATEVRASDKSGNPWLFVQYDLAFMHESGVMSHPLHRSCALPINGPQTYGAAQSYIEKQFLRQVFKVPTGEKDADTTEQSEDAPQRPTGARTAQGSPAAARTAPARQQAAPAPSADKEEATKRYKEIRAEIDASMTVPDLTSIDGCPAWVEMEKILRSVEPADIADNAMAQLRGRMAKRTEMLTGTPDDGSEGY